MSAVADVADVVERLVQQARSHVTGCPKPGPEILRAVIEYAVNRIVHTRGELVTLTVAPIHRLYPREYLRAQCIAAWLGVSDCIVIRGEGKVVLRLSCVKERLGLV